jgi:predicted nucleotidyltransferase
MRKEQELLSLFMKEPYEKFTFKQVKKYSKKKSESYIYTILKKFVKERILHEKRIGNIILYGLAIDNPKAQAYAGFITEYLAWNEKHLPFEDLKRIISKIPTKLFVFLITGSYAKKTQSKDSDIDLIVICDNSLDPKKIYAELNHECEMSLPPAHLYIFRESEFLLMLTNDKQNYGKEIIKNNLLLCGGESYFRIISEAIKHGFNG